MRTESFPSILFPAPLRLLANRFAALLISALFLSACQSGSEQPGVDGAATPATRPTAPVDSQPPPPLSRQDTTPVDRTPENDPWLFEGIPNFEDLVIDRKGDWLVVLGSAERSGKQERATLMKVPDSSLAAIQQQVWNEGAVPFAVASEELPAFTPGLTVLVLGPFLKADAEAMLVEVRRVVPDAYVKEGW